MSFNDRRGGFIGQVDWILVGLYLFLALIGWMHVWSAVPGQERLSPFELSSEAGKQFAWLIICLFIGAAVLLTDTKLFYAFRWPFYGIGLGLLLVVLVIGQEVGGNKSWIVINSFIKIQPSEFAKYFTALALAGYLATPLHLAPPAGRWPGFFWIFMAPITLVMVFADVLLGQGLQMKRVVYWLKAFALIGIPAVLVLAEKDTGSTLVYAAFILALFRFGLYLIMLYLGLGCFCWVEAVKPFFRLDFSWLYFPFLLWADAGFSIRFFCHTNALGLWFFLILTLIPKAADGMSIIRKWPLDQALGWVRGS